MNLDPKLDCQRANERGSRLLLRRRGGNRDVEHPVVHGQRDEGVAAIGVESLGHGLPVGLLEGLPAGGETLAVLTREPFAMCHGVRLADLVRHEASEPLAGLTLDRGGVTWLELGGDLGAHAGAVLALELRALRFALAPDVVPALLFDVALRWGCRDAELLARGAGRVLTTSRVALAMAELS
jgi:hypothetical protein